MLSDTFSGADVWSEISGYKIDNRYRKKNTIIHSVKPMYLLLSLKFKICIWIPILIITDTCIVVSKLSKIKYSRLENRKWLTPNSLENAIEKINQTFPRRYIFWTQPWSIQSPPNWITAIIQFGRTKKLSGWAEIEESVCVRIIPTHLFVLVVVT